MAWKESVDRLSDLGNRTAQLTLVSIAVLVIVVAAVVAGPIRDESGELSSAPRDSATRTLPDGTVVPVEPGADVEGTGAARGRRSGPVVTEAGTTNDAAAAAPTAPPITATHIKVGIPYFTDAGRSNAAAGFTGVGQVDQRRGWEAVIADINREPEFGRKVAPVWFATSEQELTSQGIERIEQQACEHWTKDNPVFLVWDGILGLDTLQSCLTKAKVPEVGSSSGLAWSQTYKKYPYVVDPTGMALDRLAKIEVDQLHAKGFFSKFKNNSAPYTPLKPADGKPRIGLIRYDTPSHKAAAVSMKQALRAKGLALCSGCEFEVSFSADNIPEQLDDATEVNAAIQSFKARGVTHVLFLGSTSGVRITIFFVDGAEKQQYRPRLGFNQQDAPDAAADFHGSSSHPQFRQSVLVTSGPGNFDELTDAFKRCKKVFEDAGETFQGDEASAKEGQIPVYCDAAWYTKEVLRAAGPSISLEAWLNGVASVNPLESAGTFVMRTTKTRKDGASGIRLGEWFDSCDCFKPTSDVIPV
jgi:hypothetical protein